MTSIRGSFFESNVPLRRFEVHPVENAVVLVRDQLIEDILILGAGHEHQVFESVAIVPAVVHVNVRRPAVPALSL